METTAPESAVAVQVALAITRLRARLRAEQASVTTGQTLSQLSVLGRIAETGPTTVSMLAQAEHVRPQSMAETVAALKRDLLVQGCPDPADGRKTLLTLTPAGQQLVGAILQSREAWLSDAIEQLLTEEDRRVLSRAAQLLLRLAESQGNVGSPHQPRGM